MYRKYRPQNFNEIAGQEFVTRAIKNSLRENKLSHAYLFNGPRGVGKTTIARLIAKGVNCLENGISDNPCGHCENCREITQGISMDMIEIDAASNRGIDEIRELKTLEEPPSHIIFILATTEIDKIPDTVISRCQRYDFQPIEKENICNLLMEVAKKENIQIDNESLDLIYRKSEGSARDSFSIFEQVVSNFNGEEIDITKTQKALGIIPNEILKEFLMLIQKNSKTELINFIDKMWEKGIVIETFLKDFAYYLKEEFRINNSLSIDFTLKLISDIFFILNEFKYEEDKRLLGYVLVHEIYKDKVQSRLNSINQRNVQNVTQTEIKVENKTVQDVDISVIENNWENIRQEVKNISRILFALFNEASPESIQNSILNIQFPEKNQFHVNQIMEIDRKTKIEKIINKICNTKIEINAICLKDEKMDENDKIINDVIRFFDGQILEQK